MFTIDFIVMNHLGHVLGEIEVQHPDSTQLNLVFLNLITSEPNDGLDKITKRITRTPGRVTLHINDPMTWSDFMKNELDHDNDPQQFVQSKCLTVGTVSDFAISPDVVGFRVTSDAATFAELNARFATSP